VGSTSIWHWIVVGLIVVLLFGRGKISDMMGDVAKGIKAFKKGMAEDDTATKPVQPSEPVRTIDHQTGAAAPTSATTDHKVG
jgi:sec-independent protein translocase protein TatA